MATTLDMINAVAIDPDLPERLTAAAAEHGIPMPAEWVRQNMLGLGSQKIAESGDDTLASILDYAKSQHPPVVAPVRAGGDKAIILDDHLRHCVAALRDKQITPQA